jgi:predicted amidophosphoribosyltransferase
MSSHNWRKDNCCIECHKNVEELNSMCRDCVLKGNEEFYKTNITESALSTTLSKPEEENMPDFNEEDEEDEYIDDNYEEYSFSDRRNKYDDDLDEYCIECHKNEVVIDDNICLECMLYIFSSPA